MVTLLPFLLDDVAEELPIREKLCDQQKTLLCFDNLVKSDNVAMPYSLKQIDFRADSQHIFGTHLGLVYDFHCHFFTCGQVESKVDLPESALTNVLP